ncbi:hypothetical protein F0U60_32455 [Archangium minus]|uniref:Uncharacterized protein n=1 Tax=Archangium minus TaxID=83450 RepID=A0ABY9WYW1_9BACT|nr:hypothetical protein F0U60_32455 [Archangium minus]
MSLRALAKKALPWIAFALALASLGYTWNWALAKASERHLIHHAFTTGTTKYIFSLCPSTPLVNDLPRWVGDMRGFCQRHHPTWGNVDQGTARAELDIENGSTWEAIQLLSKLVLEVSPAKVLSLLPLVVISLAGLLGLQQRGWLRRHGINPLSVTRGAALAMLVIVMLTLSASLVLLNEQETATMCQVTGSTYANLLSIDARCSQQTMLLRDTQALLEQKKDELEARASELEELKREIASLGAMRDALGTFKTELQSQNESTQQLIMAVTGATLDGISKAVDPLHKDVKGLDQSLKAALQSEELKDLIRREVRSAVQEDVRAVVRGELQDSMKTVLAAGHVQAPPPAAPIQAKASTVAPAKAVPPPPATRKPATSGTQAKPTTPERKQPTAPAQGKR